MTIILPRGWKDFQGGAVDPSLCLGDQPRIQPYEKDEDDNIITDLDCANGRHSLKLMALGLTAPIVWETSEGQIASTGELTAELRIASAVNLANFNPDGCPSTTCQPVGESAINSVNAWAVLYQGKVYQGGVTPCEGAFCVGMVMNCFDDVVCPNAGNNPDTGFGCGDVGYQASGGCCPYNGHNLDPNPYDPDSSPCACNDFRGVTAEYPDVGYADGTNCAAQHSSLAYMGTNNAQPDSCATLRDLWVPAFKARGAKFDVRRAELKAQGCSPCSLIQGIDIVVTAMGANGDTMAIEIHVN